MKIDQRGPLLEVGRELRRISGPAEPKSAAIGMEGERAEITAYQAPIDLDPSPALSLVGKAKPMLKGRKVGATVTDGDDGDRQSLQQDTELHQTVRSHRIIDAFDHAADASDERRHDSQHCDHQKNG